MRIDFEHKGHPVSLEGFEGDHITRQIERTKTFYELELLRYATDITVAGTVVDVGANIGNHSVYFGLFTSAEQVIAIEPFSPAAELLGRNIAANSLGNRIVQETCAVGAESGRVSLLPGKASNVGHTRVTPGDEVELRTLDDIVRDKEVSVIKIDVEGYELAVLAGAMGTLTRQRPHLFIEAPRLRHKLQLDKILKPLGYRMMRVFGNPTTYAFAAATSRRAY